MQTAAAVVIAVVIALVEASSTPTPANVQLCGVNNEVLPPPQHAHRHRTADPAPRHSSDAADGGCARSGSTRSARWCRSVVGSGGLQAPSQFLARTCSR